MRLFDDDGRPNVFWRDLVVSFFAFHRFSFLVAGLSALMAELFERGCLSTRNFMIVIIAFLSFTGLCVMIRFLGRPPMLTTTSQQRVWRFACLTWALTCGGCFFSGVCGVGLTLYHDECALQTRPITSGVIVIFLVSYVPCAFLLDYTVMRFILCSDVPVETHAADALHNSMGVHPNQRPRRRRRQRLQGCVASGSIPDCLVNATRLVKVPLTSALAPTTSSECAICLVEFYRGQTVRRLSCGHLYHSTCILTHLQNATDKVCPMCRQSPLDARALFRRRSQQEPEFVDVVSTLKRTNSVDPTDHSADGAFGAPDLTSV